MGDRYFDLGNFAVNNELDEEPRRRAARAPTSASPPGAGRLASLRLMRFMSDFREAMWGVAPGHPLRPRLRLRAATPPSTSTRMRRDRRRTRASRPGSRRPVAPRAELPGPRPLRDRRRRRRRRLARLPPGRARLGGRRPARALAAHLGLDLPLGRPRRAAARLGLADEDDDALGRPLPAAQGRVRVRPRLGRVRRHPPRLQRGADGGAAPPGRLGEDLRAAAGADLRRGGEGDVPADVDRGRARRRLAADRRLPRPLAADLRARRRRPRRAAAGSSPRPG